MNLRLAWPGAILIIVAGCGPREEISRYTARKPELIDPTLASAAAKTKPQQILGAIVVTEKTGWFFKITDDPEQVESAREKFLNFVKQVRFSEGPEPQPSWDLSEGWKELPGDQFRFATIEMPTDSEPLQIAVSVLPLGDRTPEDFVLINVNRWRGQVGLEPTVTPELAATSETFKIGKYDVTFVGLVGESTGGGMGAPFAPFAGGASTAPGSSPTEPARPKPTPPRAGVELTYDTPEGWTPGEQDVFSRVAFNIKEGDSDAKVTVSPLGPESRGLLQNVNRWRGQVELPQATAAEVAKSVKKIETLGVSGDYVELVGPEATILGVIAEVGDRVWFVKLKAEPDLAQREKPKFEAFVKSLRLQ